MPDVEPMNLPKFSTPPTSKDERYQLRYWRYKKQTPPKTVKPPKQKKPQVKDSTIISDIQTQNSHLRHINKE